MMLYVVSVLFMSNLGALVDLALHPEISYFDIEHVIVGGTTCLAMILLVGTLEAYLAWREQIEGTLRESENRFRSLFENSSDALMTLEASSRTFSSGNRAAVEMFGTRSVEEFTSHALGDFSPERQPDGRASAETWKEMIDKAIQEGSHLFEWTHKRINGVEFPATVLLTRVEIAGKQFLQATVRDITERRRSEEENLSLERQVQQAQKLESLGVLAGGIAHDFNNILMAVQGHAELALGGISPSCPARGNLAEIRTATERAADLCRQMLAYAGKASFALERVDLGELVEEMATLLNTSISRNANLTLKLEENLPPIQADPSQIRQIVMNLIINASEAIGDRSGTITVSVGAARCDEEYLQKTELQGTLSPGWYVHLEVTDTGSGMNAETRAHIFEPFFSTKVAGRGLGLASVLGIIRAFKGALKVRSEPGKGTTFKVLFPALTNGKDAARSLESSPLSGWRGKGTILLVDDEESLLTLGARMLEHLGFSVLTAVDGRQAVNLYRERFREIDLVLTDMTMPHMDGAKAFNEIQMLNPDARVVLASGYTESDVSSRFEGKKPAGIIQKPYTLARLREVLSRLLPAGSTD